MRFTTGLIFGILLTFGAAYVIDSFHSAPGPDQQGSRRMVNWDVVGDNMRDLSSDIQDAWARLVGGAKKLDQKTGT